MISITSAQLDAWIAAFLFPLARIFGVLISAPFFSNAAQPRRIRVVAGLVITVALTPALPAMPAIPPGSWTGIAVLAQQMLIGLLLGFSLRIAFAAVDVAGDIIGMQMSLSFAVFYDPQRAGQTSVVSEFLGLFATLIFLALNGHLLILATLAESFRLFPVGIVPPATSAFSFLLSWSATLFSIGLLLALPLITALLIANLGMGVLARVAPQLNIFAVGFPVTLTAGFIVLMFSIPYLGAALERLFDQAFGAMTAIMRAAAGGA